MEEIMTISNDLLSPCGLYCGACSILMAHRENNRKLKDKLAGVYGMKPEDLHCTGCLSSNESEIFPYCKVCPIKSCARDKKIEGCHQCDDFPCAHIDGFAIPLGKKVILKSVPLRREIGTEAWVRHEEERYACPTCGQKAFRGARRCNKCGNELELD
jgi:hypothetical protein